jgi:UDP-glucose 4-epimerase
MKLLVTGGAGYIGSATTRLLVEAGHQVTVLDNLVHGFSAAVDPRAHLVTGSVGDAALLDALLPGCDAVMHLAGYIEVGESQRHPERYFRNNVSCPLVMLEAMVRHGVDAIVFSSTAAVYGEPETIPITEDTATNPINAYGASKLMFEQLLDWFGRLHGLRSIRFRYFNVAGAWPDGSLGEAHDPETHIIPRLLLALAQGRADFEIFGGEYPTPDGTCVRDYIHVFDLALAHQIALERLVPGGECGVFNLGSGRGFSNLEVVKACAEVTGRPVNIEIGPPREGDPAMLVASSEEARLSLGWQPRRAELECMISDAWMWHRDHPKGYLS